jgi:acetylornithine/succinyldiaminopimelate/putrescine aminotransferase
MLLPVKIQQPAVSKQRPRGLAGINRTGRLRRPFPKSLCAAKRWVAVMTVNELLNPLRQRAGKKLTIGLKDADIARFEATDPDLAQAAKEAVAQYRKFAAEVPEIMDLDEAEQLQRLQAGFVNFYADDNINPYVAIAARGAWIITLKGAVVHDSGGYGMLGMGHAPQAVLDVMQQPHVMANIMTASLSQLKLERKLRAEIGANRRALAASSADKDKNACPFERFICMNSGSESVTVAGRIADINTKLMTDPGARHAGKKVKRIAVKGAFHGRTELPAMYSDSSRKAYAEHLASYKHHVHQLITITPYSVSELEQAFADADRDGFYIEAVFLEPVMGEGNPGRALTPEFYAAARRLTKAHGTLLLVDSIQAGLRAHGCLSVIDYPGFEHLDAPDFETYSKALNAGQYPLSVLALTANTAALYRKGIYGNTMTTNPRALEVACVVMDAITPAIKKNIVERGQEFVAKLEKLKTELNGMITSVQGTGLLFSCELSADYKCYGAGSTEEFMRMHGINVIHGGTNSLRFTPNFKTTSAEVDLVIDHLRHALIAGPRKSLDVAKAA